MKQKKINKKVDIQSLAFRVAATNLLHYHPYAHWILKKTFKK